jgi:protein-tyrosine phosphatase
MPDRVDSMLFVCLGNICRSPFAAELAQRLMLEAGRSEVRCVSAGLRPSQAGRCPREACDVSSAYGISLSEHVPQAVMPDLMASNSMVFVMELRQFLHLRAAYPLHIERIFLLSLFDEQARGPYERYNIQDPFGRPLAAYEECYERIQRSLRSCLERLPR